ncbi:MAG: winged helix-turn-helix domain-containing protein [Pleomorphochaeta sp.]|jgi:DNA-binding GntR family transcriptional regulator
MSLDTLTIEDFPKELPENSGTRQKLYLKVYDAIYEGIDNQGDNIPEGTKIPTEEEFATYWNVSRGTIREAMYHLLEDGIISKVQGRRTVISKTTQYKQYDFQDLTNPVYKTFDIDKVNVKRNLTSTSNWLAGIFSLKPGVPIVNCIVDYFLKEERVATSMFLFPFSLVEEMGLAWDNDSVWTAFVTKDIYEKANLSETSLCIITDEINDSELTYIETPVLLSEEFLFEKEKCFCFARTYLTHEKTRIKILRK